MLRLVYAPCFEDILKNSCKKIWKMRSRGFETKYIFVDIDI